MAIPLQYSCLENPMERGACWATVHGVAKSWTRTEQLTLSLSPAPEPEASLQLMLALPCSCQ